MLLFINWKTNFNVNYCACLMQVVIGYTRSQ